MLLPLGFIPIWMLQSFNVVYIINKSVTMDLKCGFKVWDQTAYSEPHLDQCRTGSIQDTLHNQFGRGTKLVLYLLVKSGLFSSVYSNTRRLLDNKQLPLSDMHTKQKRFNKNPNWFYLLSIIQNPFRFVKKPNSIGFFKIHPLHGR